MADLTITATNVVDSAGSPQLARAGGTLTRGMVVYKDAADENSLKPGNCETSSATAAAVGIALADAADGQWCPYLPSGGTINLGAILTVGKEYVLSTAGGIAPVDDLVSNDYVTSLGIATTTSLLPLNINASGVQVP